MMNMLKRNDCTKRGKKNRQMHNRSSWWKIDEITRKMNALYKNIKGEKNNANVGNIFDFISAFIAILITFFVRFVRYENSIHTFIFFFRKFCFSHSQLSESFYLFFHFNLFHFLTLYLPFNSFFLFLFALLPFFICFACMFSILFHQKMNHYVWF